MPTVLTRILSTLAVLLVAGAQVFGLQRGYLCHHQDVIVQTTADHCHHADTGTGFTPCTTAHAEDEDAAESHDDDENTERHAPLKVSTLAATPALAHAASPPFIATLLAELPAFDHLFVLHELPAAHALKTPRHAHSQRPPPAALQVARCIVLLV